MIKKNITRRQVFIVLLFSFNFFLGIFLTKNIWHWPTLSLWKKRSWSVPVFFQFNETSKKLNEEEIKLFVQQLRRDRQLPPLHYSRELERAAEQLIASFSASNYQIENQNYHRNLTEILLAMNYRYRQVADMTFIVPVDFRDLAKVFNQSSSSADMVFNPEWEEYGVGVREIELSGQKRLMVAQIFSATISAAPTELIDQSKTKIEAKAAASSPVTIYVNQTAREIPDWEVVEALNQYRADHQVHALLVDDNLCRYAEKRVQDLIAYGSLDNHEGFKKDFADSENLPESIKNYSGGAIGENLASQYCINGTTGENFVANTGTALIEWCFDSSTKGHREAQLNPRYNAVCVRHGQNMYVVIFGE